MTKPAALPPADTVDQMPQHESWCYQTLGTIDCYSEPQDTQPGRLVMVDPANRYPLNARSFRAALPKNQPIPVAAAEMPPAADSKPASAIPAPVLSTPIPPAAKAGLHTATKHVKRKKHKPKKPAKKPEICPCKDAAPTK